MKTSNMTYADLIKLLESYADEEVFFNGYDEGKETKVHFYAGGLPIFILNRQYGKDEVTSEQG